MKNLSQVIWRSFRTIDRNTAPSYQPHRTTIDQWERQYASGALTRYRQLDELARYSMIVGYCRYFKSMPAILDVGCGEGILQERLRPSYSRYVGIDVSAEAIRQTLPKQDSNTVFIESDAASYTPNERFDIVVLNECLYYFENPLQIMRRLQPFLNNKGIFIASMYVEPVSLKIWKVLKGVYAVLDDVHITHESGLSWIIKVLNTSSGTPT